jgi:hypothetical protein
MRFIVSNDETNVETMFFLVFENRFRPARLRLLFSLPCSFLSLRSSLWLKKSRTDGKRREREKQISDQNLLSGIASCALDICVGVGFCVYFF